MHRNWQAIVLAGVLSLAVARAGAVTLNSPDTFEGSGTDGWTSGLVNPNPPLLMTGGGPDGDDDGYLLLRANGLFGAGSKLVAFSGAQWAGNYTAAGVQAIRLDVNNFGATDLNLRLEFEGGFNTATTLVPVTLASGSGWQSVIFPLLPADLGGAAATMDNVLRFRLIHTGLGDFAPLTVAAQLGIDNVTAVPEPGRALLLVLGLAAMAGGAQVRQRRQLAQMAGARLVA